MSKHMDLKDKGKGIKDKTWKPEFWEGEGSLKEKEARAGREQKSRYAIPPILYEPSSISAEAGAV